MRKASSSGLSAMLAAAVIGAVLGCNNVGTCPASAITPGDSCSGDSLQCPYTLQSLSSTCDGTSVDGGIMTSCVCTKGSWQCPPPVTCPGDGGDDGGGDGATGEEAGDATGE